MRNDEPRYGGLIEWRDLLLIFSPAIIYTAYKIIQHLIGC